MIYNFTVTPTPTATNVYMRGRFAEWRGSITARSAAEDPDEWGGFTYTSYHGAPPQHVQDMARAVWGLARAQARVDPR